MQTQFTTKRGVTFKSLAFMGHPDYWVTDTGSVWSLKRDKWNKLKPQPRRLWLHVRLCKNGKAKTIHVHRLVLLAFVGPCPKGPPRYGTRHLDGNGHNNNVSNLCWGTHEANMQDKIQHGTSNLGENHYKAVTSYEDAEEMRRLFATGDYYQTEIAKMFGVSSMTVNLIVRNKTWNSPAHQRR